MSAPVDSWLSALLLQRTVREEDDDGGGGPEGCRWWGEEHAGVSLVLIVIITDGRDDRSGVKKHNTITSYNIPLTDPTSVGTKDRELWIEYEWYLELDMNITLI